MRGAPGAGRKGAEPEKGGVGGDGDRDRMEKRRGRGGGEEESRVGGEIGWRVEEEGNQVGRGESDGVGGRGGKEGGVRRGRRA